MRFNLGSQRLKACLQIRDTLIECALFICWGFRFISLVEKVCAIAEAFRELRKCRGVLLAELFEVCQAGRASICESLNQVELIPQVRPE